MEQIEMGRQYLDQTRVSPADRKVLDCLGLAELKNGVPLARLLRRPDVTMTALRQADASVDAMSREVRDQLEIEIKYEGYIQRQVEQVERFKRSERIVIPPDLDYAAIEGLSTEVREKLQKVRPRSLGQAARIPAVTPAAIAILAVVLRRQ
jgi:tRNA uridine 5-carboxymethylaminomethyl modification enzyme